MKMGMRNPAGVDALYGSETKFGYDGTMCTRDYRYVVDGEKLTFRQIAERLPDVPEPLLRTRLYAHYKHTWEGLSRAKHAVVNKPAVSRYAKQKKAYERRKLHEEAKRCQRATEKAGHKEL